jgi:hypothetical protein
MRLRPDGGLARAADLGLVSDLAVIDGGELLVVDALAGVRRVALFDADGRLIAERPVQAASCVATRPGRVLVGTSDGQLFSTDAGLSVQRRRALAAAILDVEPAADGWFVLEDTALGRLLRLDDDLAVHWSVALDRRSDHLCVVQGASAVWAVGTGARLFGDDGAAQAQPAEFPMRTVQASVAWRNGGLLAVAPGAVLHLDRHGRLAPGQGGFDFLVDLSAVPEPIR